MTDQRIGPTQEEVLGAILQAVKTGYDMFAPGAIDAYKQIQGAEFAVPGTDYTNQDLYDSVRQGKEQVRDWAQRVKEEEFQSEGDYNWFKDFMSETGADLAEFLPESNAGFAAEGAEELLPLAKLLAFLPPGIVKKLTKAVDFDKAVKDLAGEFPAIAQLVKRAEGDTSVLEPLVKATRMEPHTSIHASPVRFTGDEVDLKFAGSGAGGDMMGQGLYRAQREAGVGEGYKFDFDMAALRQHPKANEFQKEAVRRNPALAWGADQREIDKATVAIMNEVDPDFGGHLLEFTTQPGTAVYVADKTNLTQPQKKAMFNAMPDVLKELGFEAADIERIMTKVLKGGTEGRPSLKNPTGMIGRTDSGQGRDEFMNYMTLELKKKFPRAMGTIGRDFLNRLRMEIGYDDIEYPSGQIYQIAKGHRNWIGVRPEIFKSSPIEVPRIAREPLAGEGSQAYRQFKQHLDRLDVLEKERFKAGSGKIGKKTGKELSDHMLTWSIGEDFIRDYSPGDINLGEGHLFEALGELGEGRYMRSLIQDLNSGKVDKDTLLMEWDNFFNRLIKEEAGGDKAFTGAWKEYMDTLSEMHAIRGSLAKTVGDTPESNLISRMVRGKDYMPVVPSSPIPD